MKVTEVNLTPIRPRGGLVGFASCVIDDSLYLGSIAVHSRPDGSYRLVFPTKLIGGTSVNLFNPITKIAGEDISRAVCEKCEEIFGKRDERSDYDGHGKTCLSL